MSATPYNGVLDPIYLRLENPDGILRQTSDSSMLLEALLDIGKPTTELSDSLDPGPLTSPRSFLQSSISLLRSVKHSKPKSSRSKRDA